MIQNLHIHSVLDDGISTMEDMVVSAMEKGLTSMGFSGHSVLPFENDWAMKDYDTYLAEIDRLKEKYGFRIYTGLELDTFSERPPFRADYMIGSVHNLKKDGDILSVDLSVETVIHDIDKYFGGDSTEYAKAYFKEMRNIRGVDIVGHFDLVEKFNEDGGIFRSSEYMPYALEALHELASRGFIFEINTGAMSRGYRTFPYPAPELLKELNRLGCPITITTDCHNCDHMDFAYDLAVSHAKDCGYDEIMVLTDSGFKPVSLYVEAKK